MLTQQKFRYFINNEEVSNREDYLNSTMTGEFITFLEGDSVFSFPISDFLDGERHQSNRGINERLKDVIKNIYEEQNKVFKDLPESYTKALNEAQEGFIKAKLTKCSGQCFCGGSCKKPQQNNLFNSTRHKAREVGKFHKDNFKDFYEYAKDNIEERLENMENTTDRLSIQSFYQVIYTKPTSNFNKFEITFSDNDFEKIKNLSVGDIKEMFNSQISAKKRK